MNKQILYFYNPKCGHCNAFDNASKDFFTKNIDTNKDIELIKFTPIDIDNNKANLNKEILYKLKGTPTLLFIENGNFHEELTVIGNNFGAFKKSFNIFMKFNENIESKATIKAEGICAKVHKIETTSEASKPTFGEHKSESVKAKTCGAHKSEPVKPTFGAHKSETVKPTTTCGAHKSEPVKPTFGAHKSETVKPTTTCGAHKSETVKPTTCGAHKSEPVKPTFGAHKSETVKPTTTCGAHKSETVKTTCGANKLKSDQ